MNYDFDRVIERRGSDSIKWRRYGDEVLPLWVADMDFVSPEPVIKALHERVDHAVFGYGGPGEELVNVIRQRLKRLYDWDVPAEHIVFVPGVVTGLNLAFQLFAGPGDAVLVQPPVYLRDRFRCIREEHHGFDQDICALQSAQPCRPGFSKR
ncbi:MAG: aminotransferase class [Deltaproteobacteria bacterium]|nr:aminotransferase class [Deltaproteobacteria bacterium]